MCSEISLQSAVKHCRTVSSVMTSCTMEAATLCRLSSSYLVHSVFDYVTGQADVVSDPYLIAPRIAGNPVLGKACNIRLPNYPLTVAALLCTNVMQWLSHQAVHSSACIAACLSMLNPF